MRTAAADRSLRRPGGPPAGEVPYEIDLAGHQRRAPLALHRDRLDLAAIALLRVPSGSRRLTAHGACKLIDAHMAGVDSRWDGTVFGRPLVAEWPEPDDGRSGLPAGALGASLPAGALARARRSTGPSAELVASPRRSVVRAPRTGKRPGIRRRRSAAWWPALNTYVAQMQWGRGGVRRARPAPASAVVVVFSTAGRRRAAAQRAAGHPERPRVGTRTPASTRPSATDRPRSRRWPGGGQRTARTAPCSLSRCPPDARSSCRSAAADADEGVGMSLAPPA